MTQSDIVRQRAVVTAALDIPSSHLDSVTLRLQQALRAHAIDYAGMMPHENSKDWLAWKDRVEAFEWIVSQRLYRAAKAGSL